MSEALEQQNFKWFAVLVQKNALSPTSMHCEHAFCRTLFLLGGKGEVDARNDSSAIVARTRSSAAMVTICIIPRAHNPGHPTEVVIVEKGLFIGGADE